MGTSRRAGCTLVEIIVALVVVTTGALGLAAGSAILAREMGTNDVRAEAARMAAGRLEMTHSACPIAKAGRETRGSIVSEWMVSPIDSTRLRLDGTVSYVTVRGRRSEPYAATIRCQ